MATVQELINRHVPLNELEQVLKYLFLNNIPLDQIDYNSRSFLKIIRPEKDMTMKETLQKFRRIFTHIAESSYLGTEMFIPPGRNIYIRKFPRYLADTIHNHKDALEINVVLQGEFLQRINGNSLYLKAGDICLIAPMVNHGTRAFDDNTVTLSLMVYQDVIRDLLYDIDSGENDLILFLSKILYGNIYHPFLVCRTDFDTDLVGMVLDMEENQDEKNPYINQYMKICLELFILRLLMKYKDRITLGRNVEKNDSDILNLMDYIEAHYRDVTLNSLAQTYNYSPAYLSGLIKVQFGRSFHEIITDIKMRRAVNLLQTTDLSMASIAETVGYTDKSYFLRRFKQIYNMTPTQFKKNQMDSADLS